MVYLAILCVAEVLLVRWYARRQNLIDARDAIGLIGDGNSNQHIRRRGGCLP